MLMGTNAALSLFAGAVFCWGILGPLLLEHGVVFSMYGYPEGFIEKPSAQYWLLWPGIAMLLVAALTELAFQAPVIWQGVSETVSELVLVHRTWALPQRHLTAGPSEPLLTSDDVSGMAGIQPIPIGVDEFDPAPLEQQVPTSYWLVGLLLSSIFTVAVLTGMWDVSWYEAVTGILISFLLAYMAAIVTGETDNNPQGTVAKMTQFVFAGMSNSQATNLIAGNVSLCCAGQAADMLQDLRTGHLLGASPRAQFIGQLWGSLFGVFGNVLAFYLIAQAYPCLLVLPTKDAPCNFAMPAAQSWYGISYALTHGFTDAIPITAAWTSLGVSLAAIILVVVRKKASTRHRPYILSPIAFGLAFTFPSPYILTSMAIGGVLMHVWQRFYPKHHEKYGFAVGAGLLAGEGLGGFVWSCLILVGATWVSTYGT
jgi:OPT family oligopeptide transporter